MESGSGEDGFIAILSPDTYANDVWDSALSREFLCSGTASLSDEVYGGCPNPLRGEWGLCK
jgi:hypothetical protein